MPTRTDARPYYIRAWAADPFAPTEAERAAAIAEITGVTVHYTASSSRLTPEQIAAYQTGPGAQEDFPSIAYTLLVDATGTVYQCHDLETRTWHSGAVVGGVARNRSHIGICFIGSLAPYRDQLRGLGQAIAWCERQLGRTLEIEGHQDSWATVCPGGTWDTWRMDLMGVIEAYRS